MRRRRQSPPRTTRNQSGQEELTAQSVLASTLMTNKKVRVILATLLPKRGNLEENKLEQGTKESKPQWFPRFRIRVMFKT